MFLTFGGYKMRNTKSEGEEKRKREGPLEEEGDLPVVGYFRSLPNGLGSGTELVR